jgi:hypothetical protein
MKEWRSSRGGEVTWTMLELWVTDHHVTLYFDIQYLIPDERKTRPLPPVNFLKIWLLIFKADADVSFVFTR